MRELRGYSRPTPDLARNLRIVLEDFDDPARAVERDPRSPGGGGYSGTQAMLRYVFGQSLTINAFDELGYMVRSASHVSQCAAYADAAEAQQAREGELPRLARAQPARRERARPLARRAAHDGSRARPRARAPPAARCTRPARDRGPAAPAPAPPERARQRPRRRRAARARRRWTACSRASALRAAAAGRRAAPARGPRPPPRLPARAMTRRPTRIARGQPRARGRRHRARDDRGRGAGLQRQQRPAVRRRRWTCGCAPRTPRRSARARRCARAGVRVGFVRAIDTVRLPGRRGGRRDGRADQRGRRATCRRTPPSRSGRARRSGLKYLEMVRGNSRDGRGRGSRLRRLADRDPGAGGRREPHLRRAHPRRAARQPRTTSATPWPGAARP